MSKSYLVIYTIKLQENKAFFWAEKDAKAFVEAIKPLQTAKDSTAVLTVDTYAKNFQHQ